MKISPLALRVTGFDDEPVWGLAWRLARRQGARIETFCQEHGLKWRDIASGRHAAHIAALAGVDPAMVEAATPKLDGEKNVTFGSEGLTSFDLVRSPGRVCPGCLRDDVQNAKGLPEYRTHWRGWWRMRAIAVCPIHRVRLLDCNPTTGKPLNGLAPDPRYAGGPETDLAACCATPVASAAGEAYLLSRLRSPGSSQNPFLDRFPLQAVIRILDRLGAARVGGREAFTSFDGTVDQHEAIDAGFGMLERGEDGLREFLDELFETAEPANGNWGPRETYGLIYDWLNRDRIHGGTLLDPIRNIVAEHALANIPLNPNEPLFGMELPARRLYTLHHVWTETGIHPDRLRPILMALGLIDEKTARRENWHIILDRDGLERAQAVSREMIDRKQAQTYLGVPRGIMPSILEAGLLTPLTQGGDEGKGSMVFLRSELDQWIERLAGNAPFLSHKIPGLEDIVAASRQTQWTSAAIVEALLDGRLQAAGRIQDAPPFMSIMIDVVEARKLMMETCDVPVATGLSWEQAVAAIGCTHYVLKDLVAKEAVVGKAMKSVFRGRTLMVFEPDEITKFNEKYISMKEAASYLGAHSRSVAARVAPLNVSVAIEIDDLPASSFFLRAEIEALDQFAFESPRTRKRRLDRSH